MLKQDAIIIRSCGTGTSTSCQSKSDITFTDNASCARKPIEFTTATDCSEDIKQSIDETAS